MPSRIDVGQAVGADLGRERRERSATCGDGRRARRASRAGRAMAVLDGGSGARAPTNTAGSTPPNAADAIASAANGREAVEQSAIITSMINVTEAAAEKITELLTEENKIGAGLRVFVQGGGCSGFQYGLMIDEGEGDPRVGSDVRGERRAPVRRSHQPAVPARAPKSTSSTTTWAAASPSRTRTPSRPAAADRRSRVVRPRGRFRPRPSSSRNTGPRAAGAPASATSSSTCSSARRDTSAPTQLVDLIRQRGRADQPRHHLPHAAVDGRRRHRAPRGLRRGPVPVRALVPPSAALPSHLQDLQPVVRVPELGHRDADRGSGGRARISRRAQSVLQIYGTCEACRTGQPPRRRRRRPTRCSRATRCAWRSRPSAAGCEFYTRAAKLTRDARGRQVFERLATEEKDHLGKLEARYRELRREQSAARIAADVPLLQGRGQRPVCGRHRGAEEGRRRSPGAAHRHPLRARLAQVLQALRRALRGVRRQAHLPRVRRRGARASRSADSRIPRARRPPAAGVRATGRRRRSA